MCNKCVDSTKGLFGKKEEKHEHGEHIKAAATKGVEGTEHAAEVTAECAKDAAHKVEDAVHKSG